jgi:gluconolactonase
LAFGLPSPHNDGVVAVLSPSGARLGTITVASSVTNVAFGGADRKTLFITKLNPPTLYSVNVGIAGYPY